MNKNSEKPRAGKEFQMVEKFSLEINMLLLLSSNI